MIRETPAQRTQIDQVRRMLYETMQQWRELGFAEPAILNGLKEGPMK